MTLARRAISGPLVALALAVGVASALPSATAADPYAAMGVDRPTRQGPAHELALPSLDGKLVRLRDFQGKAVLLGFFTTA